LWCLVFRPPGGGLVARGDGGPAAGWWPVGVWVARWLRRGLVRGFCLGLSG